jgi:hypothetical protein
MLNQRLNPQFRGYRGLSNTRENQRAVEEWGAEPTGNSSAVGYKNRTVQQYIKDCLKAASWRNKSRSDGDRTADFSISLAL